MAQEKADRRLRVFGLYAEVAKVQNNSELCVLDWCEYQGYEGVKAERVWRKRVLTELEKKLA